MFILQQYPVKSQMIPPPMEARECNFREVMAVLLNIVSCHCIMKPVYPNLGAVAIMPILRLGLSIQGSY